jgi:hypothetical protein
VVACARGVEIARSIMQQNNVAHGVECPLVHRAEGARLAGESGWFWRQRGARGVALTCPNCGNTRNFQVKTLQVHVVQLEGERVEVLEESRPAVFEVLCDECETALDFAQVEEALRREVLLTIGAR